MLCGQMYNSIQFTSNEKSYTFNIRDFDIDKRRPLGIGIYVVYKAKHIPSNRSVAIKYIPHEHLKQELENLTAVINCPNIVRLYGFGSENTNTLIIMEKMDFSLKNYIKFAHKMQKGFPEDLLGCIVVAMINAFCWIADRRIIHRDVKPQNILLSYNGQIKLCDFGASKLVSESWSATTFAGTLRYMPPEKFDSSQVGIPYNEKCDMWSLGITLIECIALKLPFLQGKESEFEIINAVINIDPVQLIENTVNNNDDLKNFLYCCLAKNPQERSSSNKQKNSSLYLKYRDKTSQFVEALILPFWWEVGIRDNISAVLSKFARFVKSIDWFSVYLWVVLFVLIFLFILFKEIYESWFFYACVWHRSAPICGTGNDCPINYPNMMYHADSTYNAQYCSSSFGHKCWQGEKNLCCNFNVNLQDNNSYTCEAKVFFF